MNLDVSVLQNDFRKNIIKTIYQCVKQHNKNIKKHSCVRTLALYSIFPRSLSRKPSRIIFVKMTGPVKLIVTIFSYNRVD